MKSRETSIIFLRLNFHVLDFDVDDHWWILKEYIISLNLRFWYSRLLSFTSAFNNKTTQNNPTTHTTPNQPFTVFPQAEGGKMEKPKQKATVRNVSHPAFNALCAHRAASDSVSKRKYYLTTTGFST